MDRPVEMAYPQTDPPIQTATTPVMTGEKPRSLASKIVLPRFTLTEVCASDEPGATERVIKPAGAESVGYFFRPSVRPAAYFQTGPTYSYNLMPVVLDGTGAPWADANLYLLARIEGVLSPSMTTYHGIADDLSAFYRFLQEDGVDYKGFPRRRLLRPTYRYRAYLQQRIMAGEIAPTTARRRISTVIGFYRWLSTENVFVPDNPPWEEHDVYIQLTDDVGFRRSKVVVATDIGVRVPVQNDPYAGTIEDGGKLRPLHLSTLTPSLRAHYDNAKTLNRRVVGMTYIPTTGSNMEATA